MSWLEPLLGPPAQWSRVLLLCLGAYLAGCVAGGYYLVRPSDQDVIGRPGFSWTASPTVTLSGVASVARQPRCVIEQLDGVVIPASGKSVRAELPQSTGTAYRVTAQGVGANENTAVVLQSYFHRD